MFNREKQEIKRVPMMPVRDMVHLSAADDPVYRRPRSPACGHSKKRLAGDKKIFLSTQHDASVDDRNRKRFTAVGTLATSCRA